MEWNWWFAHICTMITWSMARRNQPGLICSCCMTQISHGAMKQRQVASGSRGSNGSSTDAGEISWFDWGLSNLRGSHGACRRAWPQLFWPCHTTSRFWCEAQTCWTCWTCWMLWVCCLLFFVFADGGPSSCAFLRPWCHARCKLEQLWRWHRAQWVLQSLDFGVDGWKCGGCHVTESWQSHVLKICQSLFRYQLC